MLKINFFSLLFFCVLYFPLFPDYIGLGLEYSLSLLIVLVLLVAIKIKTMKANILSIVVFSLFLLLTLTSLLRSVDDTIVRDLFELIKPVLFVIVFIYGLNLVNDNDDLIRVVSTITLAYSSLVLLGLLESKIGVFNDISAVIYKGVRDPVQNKAVLSFISPYTFASVLILPVFYFGSKLLFDREKFRSILFFLLSVICLLLTQSKTVALGFVLTSILFFIVILSRSWMPNRRTITFALCIFSLFLILIIPFLLSYAEENLQYLYYGFEVVVSKIDTLDWYQIVYSTPSISNRFEQMVQVLDYQDVLPIIGKGIVKDLIYPESFYALYLLRYGLIGIIVHLGFVLSLFYMSLKLAKYYVIDNKNLMCFFLSVAGYCISLPFSYFSSAVNDQTRSGFIFYLIFGFCVSSLRYIRRVKK